MEFKEYNNPEDYDYDIRSSLDGNSSGSQEKQYCHEQLFDLIGILEDVTEKDLLINYGITIQEYLRPTKETIKKVTEKLNSISKGKSR